MKVTASEIKKLRDETGAGVVDCKKALTEADGDYKKALTLVKERGLAKAEKKADRDTNEGAVFAYVHATGRVAAMVELLCETDFVARNDEFQTLGKNIAMQVVAMNPESLDDLLDQEYIRDAGATIGYLVRELTGKIGEKISIKRFTRYELGDEAK